LIASGQGAGAPLGSNDPADSVTESAQTGESLDLGRRSRPGVTGHNNALQPSTG
jgi:hypothetical protein